jgi:photosystem II stability/assembly factor-like uncharacterized protein
VRTFLVLAALIASTEAGLAQAPEFYRDMQWRSIGPYRGGRARALAGVPSQPNVFYIGFDNGGLWRSTDYGSTWIPLFDRESTGSIGAIAVAPSNPNVIYVGTGAGIIRPDLATGNGVYKSIDAGTTWTRLGLEATRMIANIEVDPRNPDRLFVAALGRPYGPNPERGIFRSTDGGRTFQKVLYRDEYTSGNDVRLDPANPEIVYAALWQQQQSFIEGGAFGGTGGGIFKSTDGGTTWRQLAEGLPAVVQANLAVAPGAPNVLYAMVAGVRTPSPIPATPNPPTSGMYRSTDQGEHWTVVTRGPGTEGAGATLDARPLGRIGGGDLPTITVDPKNENVVYSASTVMWRTENGGRSWSAVRGAPGGDDYQKVWINPNNPDIILAVADQGAVVSANRGASWSNWYTQLTAAMYHVTADNAFPYRLCGGQQDAGSACVASRSDDGEITFHDWHPANIQEYGIAAPDPRNPDRVYGSARTNVSLYDRKTGQTTQVGPDLSVRGPGGEAFNRNVRTMPLHWSPANPDVLFYASNAVWKTTDRAHSWTRISPDLARQTWEVPANAGQYASTVAPRPQGAITALAPSPRTVNVLWAGTDDGTIQVTMNGGATWTNVTPSAIKPWTRIFNLEAGHFDSLTAYAAANTLRVDDFGPHFWRTHDGGKTWTEINTGIAPDAVANSIREDPRQKGLLYAATDAQVWVSFDDGAHWESLRLNMPAISVRDIRVKDDSTCLCADLVAGTHGRGFWILDNLTPLRQIAQAREARANREAYLFRPAAAVRVRFGTNDPTPWPPELPAGQNPPPGALIDYYLSSDAAGPVRLEIVDSAGKTIRAYSSADPLPPDPAANRDEYDRVCQQNPTAPHCGLPLYWPAPVMTLATSGGMHRFSWDMRYEPLTPEDGPQGATISATGAVPFRTYPQVNSPWAPPGRYTVRLAVNGKTYSQPLTVRLDPRVKTPAAALARVAALTREMYEGAQAARAGYAEARRLLLALERLEGQEVAGFRVRVESLAPPPRQRGGLGGPGGGLGGAPAGPPTLESVANAALAAAMAMQRADVAPTVNQVEACSRARTQLRDVMTRWETLRTRDLARLNASLRAAGKAPVPFP